MSMVCLVMPFTTSHKSSDRLMTRVTLLQRARDERSDLAWRELLGYYEPFISKVLGSMGFRGADLDDARQQVSLRLWKGLKTYERDPERAKFRTWFARLIRNTALNIIRSEKREPTGRSIDDESAPLQELLADTPEIETRVEKEWQQYVVDLALDRAREAFSGNAVEVFTMSLSGHSVENTAKQLGIKTNTVYILKHRVKTMLLREIQILKRDLETFDKELPSA
ncbi:sigma-70 family RNA polymerase sigma factor [bacterium]|nr:sigma-70 family RNA polymerase sigma factor [bacterium]MDB4321852.1 sigma-70 family RNA polymerase sigma factor [Akkermansiaceae bacterium]MDB4541255.1 sigma-70 family RNA polymerase sigma factor [Akkermansiaceae bacterium]MDC1286189.1 sigma-70 family RNA polymerase sigma factor [Akkermansiaceae bacterium]